MATNEMKEMLDDKPPAYGTDMSSGNGDDMPRPWHQRCLKRHILAFMAFLGFCNIYALRVNLSVAIVAMVNNHTKYVNGTAVQVRDFNWDSKTQGMVLGSFFYGYIVTQIPGGWLSGMFGGKYLFGGGILGTAVLTLITPPATKMSVYFLVAIRVIEGLFEGVTYPCIHAIWSKWAPPFERSKLATFAFSGSYVGTVIALPLSGVIADSLGWPAIFYIFGSIAVVWYLVWLYLVAESPAEHTTISQAELEYLQRTIGFNDEPAKTSPRAPWKSIFLSLPVWAIIAAHTTENWGFYTLLTELPTFFKDILHYDLYMVGGIAAIPYLVMAIVVQLGGQLADLLRRHGILSTTIVRKVFTCGAFLSQMVFMIITAYTVTPAAAVSCLTISVGLGGFAWAGFSVNHLDLAPQYAGILMGLSNTFATLPGIISPAITGAIVQHKMASEWRIIFYITAGIYFLGTILYAIFASGEKQKWAESQMAYQPHLDTVDEVTEEQED